MKSCKNDRFSHQHKIYEQGRRNQISQLISSLFDCLPREHKPQKDKQAAILSAVLSYVRLLRKQVEEKNAAAAQENVRSELEKLKAYAASLEERCDRYAKCLDAKGNENPVPSCDYESCAKRSNGTSDAAASGQHELPVSGTLSVVAAAAPLVFLVSQCPPKERLKTFVDASTSTVNDSSGSLSNDSAIYVGASGGVTSRDAAVATEKIATTDRGTDTENVQEALRSASSVAVQVESASHYERGCSPVIFDSPSTSDAVADARKRQLSDSELRGVVSCNETSNKTKRRRSDELTPTISEIVNLVAANGGLESADASGVEASVARDPQSSGDQTMAGGKTPTPLLSVSVLLRHQSTRSEEPRYASGQQEVLLARIAAASASTASGTALDQSATIAVSSSSWCSYTSPVSVQSGFANRELPQQSQQQSHAEGTRNQQTGAPTYQNNLTDVNRTNYAALSADSSASTDGRVNADCAKSNCSSRRGANFSVEFLHGGGGVSASTERLLQRNINGGSIQAHRQSRSSVTSQSTNYSYQQEPHLQTPAVTFSCDYYEPQNRSYTSSNSRWPVAADHSWQSDAPYQWWPAQVQPPPTFHTATSSDYSSRRTNNGGFPRVSHGNKTRSSTSGGDGKQGANTSRSPTTRATGNLGQQSDRGSLSSSMLDPLSALGIVSTSAVGTSISTSSTAGPYGYGNNGGRFGCCAPSFFADPSNFGCVRRNNVGASASTPVSSSSSNCGSGSVSFSAAAVHPYSHQYWPATDWTPSAFFVNDDSSSAFVAGEQSTNQHQHNHGKVQNFQIATMFPEATLSSPAVNDQNTNWRQLDGYRRQEQNVQSEPVFGNGTITAGSNGYVVRTSYEQSTGNGACTGGMTTFS